MFGPPSYLTTIGQKKPGGEQPPQDQSRPQVGSQMPGADNKGAWGCGPSGGMSSAPVGMGAEGAGAAASREPDAAGGSGAVGGATGSFINLPDIPSDVPAGGSQPAGENDIDFDELTKRFEQIKKKK